MIHEQTNNEAIPTGPASAAFVAAGIGCLAIGVFATLAEVSEGVKNFLNWWNPAGPLTGKTGWAVVIWIIAWIGLHVAWKSRTDGFSTMFLVSLALIALGAIGTFPPFFLSFSH